jgi:hypothetical protein
MRTTGLCLALLASLELVALSTPALAQGGGSDSWPPRKAFVDPGAAPAPDTAPAPGTVTVHINSSRTVTLQHRSTESSAWETLCTSPCDVRAPVGDQYQIVSDSGKPTKAFALDASKGDTVTLDVKTTGTGQRTGGWILAGTGGAMFIGGWVVILANLGTSAISGQGQDDAQSHDAHNNGMFIGTGLIIAGLCAGIYGTSLVIGAGKSDVGGNVQAPPPASGKSDQQTQHTAELVPPTAPAIMVPILQGKF